MLGTKELMRENRSELQDKTSAIPPRNIQKGVQTHRLMLKDLLADIKVKRQKVSCLNQKYLEAN